MANNLMGSLSGLSFSKGAIAGGVATIPMTLFLLIAHRMLPEWQQYALPPERITTEVAKKTGIPKPAKEESQAGSLVAHFGYGASMGSLYSTFGKRIPGPSLLKGMIFGVGVWAASYLGWLPALKIDESAYNEPAQRNLMMIVAHLIWGGVLGIISGRLGD